MRIGIIKETKVPEDNRVTFTPEQVVNINQKYNCQIFIQKSNSRAIEDNEYEKVGIKLIDDLSNCDILFGIKEVDIHSLIPNKHYFFFGHIAKLQKHNKSLLQKMMKLGITFTDYEYLVNENNKRVVSFGWWAGAVGVYNTIRAWGLRHKSFNLEKPHIDTTLEGMISDLQKIKMPVMKIIVTGKGQASQGAQHVLDHMGIKPIDALSFLDNELELPSYAVLCLEEIVVPKNKNNSFNRHDFKLNPQNYESNFMSYATKADMLISCHYWGDDDPIYLNYEDLKNPKLKIKVVGDVTCDIMGSIKSTIRPSTHAEPFYDYNKKTEKEELPFTSESNITVMAVDALPNALPTDTSKSFGEQLIDAILPDLFSDEHSTLIENATILIDGKITEKFSYLNDFILQD